MVTSAELRWFWRGRCPQPVNDWFFKSGLPPGGGLSQLTGISLSGVNLTLASRDGATELISR
jgi:hypothetical protein